MKVITLIQGVHEDLGSQGDSELVNVATHICGTVVLIKSENDEEKNIIVDTGNLGYEDEIIEGLKKEGLTPDDIEYIINTHSHLNHLSNNYLFKKATRVTGKAMWYPNKSFKLFKDLAKVPFVEIIDTKGHIEPHISVVVESEGRKIVIAGDAIGKFYPPITQGYIDSAKKNTRVKS